jgi:4-amino-4-deoxy-L-arabinose transferase-like glycosyltransferase
MWAGLASYILEYPQYYKGFRGQDHAATLYALKSRQTDLPLQLLVTGRRILILFNTLVLLLGFLFAQKILGKLPALIGFLLLAFDPFHIALSKVLHLDGTVANLIMLSLIAFLVYLERRDRLSFIVSAIAAGLAWLTKSPSLFLIPFMFLILVLYHLGSKSADGKTNRWKAVLSDAKMLLGWGLIAALVFFLLWPAMWVNPLSSINTILAAALGYAEGGHESALFFNGHIYPDGKITDLRFYLISFLWRTTPIILLGLVAAPFLLFTKDWFPQSKNKPEFQTNHFVDSPVSQRWAVGILLLFALGFMAFMTIGLKKFDRYIIPSFVLLDLVAGVSLVWIVSWMAKYLPEKWRTAFIGVILFGAVAVQAALAWTAFPYFFDYYNPLLGGSNQAVKVMQVGWGEGLDQAARYINEKPNSSKLSVMSWYGSGSFFYFSKSRVYNVSSEWSASDWDQYNKSDYIVIYLEQWQRNIPAEVLDKLKDVQPEYSVWLDGLEYVRVYKIQ